MSDKYVIVSEATLDLPIHIINEYGINVIPMKIEINDKEYTHYPDEREFSIEDFYSKLKTGAVSYTSQITPVEFVEYFEEFLKQGQDILYIAFSSGLSGTYSCSLLAIEELKERYPERKIYCLDSLCASIGEGYLVYQAAIKKLEGYTIDQLRKWTEDNKRKVSHWFSVKDLFYLKRGGRVTSLEAVFGTALKIRPVLSTDERGKLVVEEKVRGSHAEMELFIRKMKTEGIDMSSQTVFIGHGNNLKQAKKLEAVIRDNDLVKDVIISRIGPVIGTHTGPGMLALVFMGENGEL